MAQLSRPFQIALGAVVVLGLVWAVALRAHSSNPSEPVPTSPSAGTSSTSAPAKTNGATNANEAGAPTHIYHGSAPGVEGLSRAIAKAHGAVATSQSNAQQLERKSSEAAQEGPASTSTSAAVAAAKGGSGATGAQKSIEAAALARKTAAHKRAGSSVKSHSGRSAAQVQVEAELAKGDTAVLLFWNPKSMLDQEVHTQATALAGRSKGTVTVHAALAHQVDMFGSITEVVHVYQTPTILIVNKHGVVSTLTGLTDVFALEQAVREARKSH